MALAIIKGEADMMLFSAALPWMLLPCSYLEPDV